MPGEDSEIADLVALRRLFVAVPHSQVAVRRFLADRKEIVGRRLIVAAAVRDLHTCRVVREGRSPMAVIELVGLDRRSDRKRVVVRLVKATARNVAGLKVVDRKAIGRKVIDQNAEHLSVADLAGNQRAATSTWKP